MRAWIMADVIPIFIALVQSILHQDNIGVTYARTLNFRMEPMAFVSLYYVAMPLSTFTIIEVLLYQHWLILLLVANPDH